MRKLLASMAYVLVLGNMLTPLSSVFAQDRGQSYGPLLKCVPGPKASTTHVYEIWTGPLRTLGMGSAASEFFPALFIKVTDPAHPQVIPSAIAPLTWPLADYDLRYDGGRIVSIQPKIGSAGVCSNRQVGGVIFVNGDDSEICISLSNKNFMAHLVNTDGPVRGYRCQ